MTGCPRADFFSFFNKHSMLQTPPTRTLNQELCEVPPFGDWSRYNPKSNLDPESEKIQNHKLLCSRIQQFQFCSRTVMLILLLPVLVPVMKFSSQYNRTLSCELGPNDVDYVDYSCHFLLSITPLCSHWIHSCFHKQSVSGCCIIITLPYYLFF